MERRVCPECKGNVYSAESHNMWECPHCGCGGVISSAVVKPFPPPLSASQRDIKSIKVLKDWCFRHLSRSKGEDILPRDLLPLWEVQHLWREDLQDVWRDMVYDLEEEFLISRFICPECTGSLATDTYVCNKCGEDFGI